MDDVADIDLAHLPNAIFKHPEHPSYGLELERKHRLDTI